MRSITVRVTQVENGDWYGTCDEVPGMGCLFGTERKAFVAILETIASYVEATHGDGTFDDGP